MNPAENTPSPFHFELSANGEQTTFQAVDGMVTEVVLKNSLREGENPFRYRIPSLPKGNLQLKNGSTQPNSKLLQWCAVCQNPEEATPKSDATLRLKDAKGNSLVEWTLHKAHAVSNKSGQGTGNGKIESLELGYLFYSLDKK
ncbi:phage tail protein [Aureisphaera galaxeae]|uniref:phage tail protein n=1 Tax=Aureisphaera galaxeae TaxID=1538023 RepID=UPI002350F215|nr:phage tail protein [Aureisphaera galaxeae]MDC8004647.1 phage tail protein [Aureisphaera galaxeae]